MWSSQRGGTSGDMVTPVGHGATWVEGSSPRSRTAVVTRLGHLEFGPTRPFVRCLGAMVVAPRPGISSLRRPRERQQPPYP